MKNKEIFHKRCKYCEKKFITKNIRKIYCSRKCERKRGEFETYGPTVIRREYMQRKICKFCNKSFLTNITNRIYCSKDCRWSTYKNRDKEGIRDWKNIAEYILERDCYTCQDCKKIGEKLVVHHIKFASEGGTEDFDNLITLCTKCHGRRHRLI